MNAKHLHLNEQKTQEISNEVVNGKGDIIIACDQCREKVIEALEQRLSGNVKMDELIRTQKTQLEMTAFFYKQEVERVMKSPKQSGETNFGNYLKRVLGAKTIIGGSKVLTFPTPAKKTKDSAEA